VKTSVVLLFILLAGITGCHKEEVTHSLPVKSLTVSDCKNHDPATKGDFPETIVMKTADEHFLDINHTNSLMNCSPGKISVNAVMKNRIITISENESSSLANCFCPYDISFRLGPIDYSEYKLILNRNGLTIKEYSFTFSKDTNLIVEISSN
jgi:hypothetical protein